MDDMIYSILVDRKAARAAFKGVGVRNLVLGVLATVPPLPEWEGCLIYEGPSPEDQMATLCLGIQGPAADVVQEALVAALERVEVAVLKLYEGGPEIRDRLARVENGVWASPF